MKKYIGTKAVSAAPALRMEDGKGNVRVELLSNCPMPQPGDAVDMGYKVVYEDGYESWCPQDVFEKAYRLTDGMSFGLAIKAAKRGKKIARAGWNGKGMFLFMVDVSDFWTPADLFCVADLQGDLTQPCMAMKTADDRFCIGWLASQADMLADDWYIVE